jgi:hypothetical protein
MKYSNYSFQLYITTLVLLISGFGCQSNSMHDLSKYGVAATILLPINSNIHHLDLIVTKELTFGSGSNRLQLLVSLVEDTLLVNNFSKHRDRVISETGFKQVLEEESSSFMYSYRFEGDTYYQFRVFAMKKDSIAILRAYPEHHLNRTQIDRLYQTAKTFAWKS